MNQRRLTLWVAIGLGLALQLVCGSLGNRSLAPGNIYTLLALSGTIILLLGCALWAEEKGYSRNYGLLAVLSIFGVILLARACPKSGVFEASQVNLKF